MARTAEDVLSRRTRALLLDAKESIRIAPVVAAIMAEEMNRDRNWIEEQVKSYNEVAKNYMIDAEGGHRYVDRYLIQSDTCNAP